MDENAAILRLAGRYTLDHVTAARFGFDLLDALIMVTITQANVEPIIRDPALQRRYATYAQTPPDEVRRPISINSVALSLGLPFETVRRRVVKMSLIGIFRVSKLGVYSPVATVNNPRHRRALELGCRRVRAFHAELDAMGCGEAHVAGTPAWRGEQPSRLVARISADYLLRLVHLLMEEVGDLLSAVLWLAIFCGYSAAPQSGAQGLHYKPFSTARLASRLRLSAETTRRRLHSLVERGLCTATEVGITIDDTVLASPRFQRLLARNRADLRRMLSALADHGIVQAWREEYAPATIAPAGGKIEPAPLEGCAR